jgi:hypothetical protein
MLCAGVVPLEPYPGAMKAWRSLCVDCGAEVTPTLRNVKARGRGCKHCVGREVSAVSDERQRELDALMRAAGFRPIAPYPGSEKAGSRCVRPVATRLRPRGRTCDAAKVVELWTP